MSTIITRLLQNHGIGVEAQAELIRRGLAPEAVHLVARSALPADTDAASRRAAEILGSLQVGPQAAAAYAGEAVRTNGTLIVVQAPLGRANAALEVLARFSPVELAAPDRYLGSYSGAWFSDALGLPTLSNNAAPLSRLLGLPLLTRGDSSTRLSDSAAPLSRALGLPLLRPGPETRSTSFGMPMLKPGPEGRTHSFGLPLLSSNPTPLSSLLGLPTLARSGRDDR